MPYPLSGIKVLDLSRVLAGPFAGRMLSDLGADVVKLEPPEGDVTRHWGVKRGDISGYYHQQNAGKTEYCGRPEASKGGADRQVAGEAGRRTHRELPARRDAATRS